MPRFVFCADYCTDPDKYTVDKRCYVTEEQKQEIPYKAVVKVNRCTETIVKKDGGFFMYTAKHCTDADIDNIADDQLTISLQNGISLPVKKYMLGEYDLEKDSNVSGD